MGSLRVSPADTDLILDLGCLHKKGDSEPFTDAVSLIESLPLIKKSRCDIQGMAGTTGLEPVASAVTVQNNVDESLYLVLDCDGTQAYLYPETYNLGADMKTPASKAAAVFLFIFETLLGPKIGIAQSGVFQWYPVPDTHCLNGSSTGFEYVINPGLTPDDPLLIYVQYGGACWSLKGCVCRGKNCVNSPYNSNHFGKDDSDGGKRPNETTIFSGAAFLGEDSPFKSGWNFVMIPYCTADAHMGDTIKTFTTRDGVPIGPPHYFKGYSNIKLDLIVMRGIFKHPRKVVIWGASAGGIGADCNLKQFRDTWPKAEMFEMNNAGAPFSAAYAPAVPKVARIWGVWNVDEDGRFREKTCPIENPSQPNEVLDARSDWSISYVQYYNRKNIRNVRKAFSDDYHDATMSQFAGYLGARDSNAALTQVLIRAFRDSIEGDANDKVYFHFGECHTERELDGNTPPSCDFNRMKSLGSSGLVAFHDWVNYWIGARSPDQWSNVIPDPAP